MGTKLVLFTAVLAGLAAYLYMYDEQRTKLWKLVNTCPLHWFTPAGSEKGNDRPSLIRWDTGVLMTKEDLAKYDGAENSLGLYLGFLGRVYDVSAKPQFYGPDGGYGFFAGKDGTKAFMTGIFNEEGLVDETNGLTEGQMIEVENWIKFYESSYIYVGKVIGNFYDEQGKPKQSLYEAQEQLKAAHVVKQKQEDEKQIFPPCNSRWRQQDGFATVSCSERSGGVQRDWVGVPRKLYSPEKGTTRCVCVKNTGPPHDSPSAGTDVGDLRHPHLQEYEDCHPESISCDFIPPAKS